MMHNVQREALKDAQEFARAKMYYGQGAGNRRKLINAVVDGKSQRDQAYARAFSEALARQDIAEHAIRARQERARRDRNETLSRNAKGLVTGNYAAMNTSVFALVVGGYFAHKTGLDIKAYEKSKAYIQKVRMDRKNKKTGKSGLYTVTHLRK